MNKLDEIKFNKNYQQLLQALKLQGKAEKTIDAYSRAVRRVVEHFDCLPEKLAPDNLKDYFAALVESHSWSTVKIDRLGLQFYWRHILKKDWQWIEIVKPPKVKTIPDHLPGILQRLDLDAKQFIYLTRNFERPFKNLVGAAHHVRKACESIGLNWVHGIRHCETFFSSC
jgi:hypothetical protein